MLTAAQNIKDGYHPRKLFELLLNTAQLEYILSQVRVKHRSVDQIISSVDQVISCIDQFSSSIDQVISSIDQVISSVDQVISKLLVLLNVDQSIDCVYQVTYVDEFGERP